MEKLADGFGGPAETSEVQELGTAVCAIEVAMAEAIGSRKEEQATFVDKDLQALRLFVADFCFLWWFTDVFV